MGVVEEITWQVRSLGNRMDWTEWIRGDFLEECLASSRHLIVSVHKRTNV